MHFTFVTAVAVATALAALFPGLAAATATPSLSASKTYSCTNNKTKGYNCPAKGKLINPMVIGYESNIANLNACRDICLSHDECITFKWVVSGGQCTQYSTTLPKMGLVFDNSQVGDMYNRNCFVCDNGTPMSTSSSSSAPSPVQPTTTTSAAQAPTTLVTTLVTTTVCETSSSSSPVPPVMTTTTQSSSTSIEPTTTSSNASAGTSPPPAVCANKGLAWAEYRSDAEDNTGM